MKKILLSLFSVCTFFHLIAQDTAVNQNGQVATGLRANEKIYVVVAVLVTILIGLFIYLIRLDKKISKMEKGS